MESNKRFKITWDNVNFKYKVSIPEYDGGEVVDANSYDTLVEYNQKLEKELVNLLDALCGEQEAEDEYEKAFGKIVTRNILQAKEALTKHRTKK
jgi:hypothetical protein